MSHARLPADARRSLEQIRELVRRVRERLPSVGVIQGDPTSNGIFEYLRQIEQLVSRGLRSLGAGDELDPGLFQQIGDNFESLSDVFPPEAATCFHSK